MKAIHKNAKGTRKTRGVRRMNKKDTENNFKRIPDVLLLPDGNQLRTRGLNPNDIAECYRRACFADLNEDQPKRNGKWMRSEIDYSSVIIRQWKSNDVLAPIGMTLRIYLAAALNSSVMRISKRFTGTNRLGKQIKKNTKKNVSEEKTKTLSLSRSTFLADYKKRSYKVCAEKEAESTPKSSLHGLIIPETLDSINSLFL